MGKHLVQVVVKSAGGQDVDEWVQKLQAIVQGKGANVSAKIMGRDD